MCSVYDEPPANTNAGGAVSSASTNALLPCCTPTGSRCWGVQGWHEDPKESSFLAVTAEGFASTTKLDKRGALPKRRCPVAGVLGCGRGPRLTMGFRDLDATKAVRDLRVSVHCNMTARTSACRIASRKLCKQEPSFCAPEPKFVSSAWQLLFPCTEESQSIKICCVAGSRPRGGPVRRGRGCAKQGDAGRTVEEASTLSPRRRGKRAVLTKKKVHGHQARRDPWSSNRRETRLVVCNFVSNIVNC